MYHDHWDHEIWGIVKITYCEGLLSLQTDLCDSNLESLLQLKKPFTENNGIQHTTLKSLVDWVSSVLLCKVPSVCLLQIPVTDRQTEIGLTSHCHCMPLCLIYGQNWPIILVDTSFVSTNSYLMLFLLIFLWIQVKCKIPEDNWMWINLHFQVSLLF